MIERNTLMLSSLQHFAFCRRQWALIHVEQQWTENLHTAEGQVFHQRAHNEKQTEVRGDTIIVRGMRVQSDRLGVSGVCDVVEFHRSQSGVTLAGREGLFDVYPIEYKKGAPKAHQADELQLCAQAMCLEEMLLCSIAEGSLFYGETRRRTRVALTPELRALTEQMLSEMRQYDQRGYTPKVRRHKGCAACSLKEICLPGMEKMPARACTGGNAMRKLLNTLFVTSEDVYLALENENVVVLSGEEKKGQFPLVMLEGIVSFSYKGASPALMGACAKRGVELCFMTPSGRFLARVCGEERGNVLLRKKQYRISDDPSQSCRIARSMIFGKTYNSRWVLERAIRDHPLRIDAEQMRASSLMLAGTLETILEQTELDSLLAASRGRTPPRISAGSTS